MKKVRELSKKSPTVMPSGKLRKTRTETAKLQQENTPSLDPKKQLNRGRNPYENTIIRNSQHIPSIQYEPIRLYYTTTSRYTPDFSIISRTGKRIFIESKGYLRPSDRRLLLAVIAQNPHIDLRLLFQNSQKRISSAKGASTYAKWAEKHKITYTDGEEIPNEWLLE